MHHGFGGPPRHGGRHGGWSMQPPIWGFLQPCLLLLLAEGPQHGYSMLEELERRNLLGSGVDVGNLYRTLRKMEALELVQSSWSGGDGPNKRVYQITPQGKSLLQQWAGALEQRTSILTTFLNEFHRIFGPEGATPPEPGSSEEGFI